MTNPARAAFIKWVIILGGLVHLVIGVMLLLLPETIFETVGNFPPFNRHYTGDVGAFFLPVGIGLLVASREPVRHRLMVGVAALTSLLHVLNHAWDAVGHGDGLTHWVVDVGPLTLMAVLLGLAWYWSKPESRIDG